MYYEGVRAVGWEEGTWPSGVGRAEQAAGAVGVSVWFSQAGSIVLLLRIFDVGGELGEDVDACCVRFPVFRSQSGVPGMDDAV